MWAYYRANFFFVHHMIPAAISCTPKKFIADKPEALAEFAR